MSQIDVTDLDFDRIKQSIKDYISDQDEFKDYNFQGSVVNLLLDILAYNSYQNAFYTSMVGNEMFLDSAQLRDSVVSRAKMLGYIPISAKSAKTTISITYNDISGSDVVVIPKGEVFNVTSETGGTLQFITNQAYSVYKALSYTTNVDVFEGFLIDQTFTIDTSINQKFILNNQNIDTDSLIVIVRDSLGSTNTEVFNLANDVQEVLPTTPVYFIQEIANGEYEIYFGDDNIGKKPIDGNIVEISYRVTLGPDGNDIKTTSSNWSAVDTDILINSVESVTYGGSVAETIDSIKFNAPKNYETQNRAVLAEDYKRLIIRENSDLVESLRVWGGEDNDPPVYGKVFLSINPKGAATVLSNTQKDTLRKDLKKYNVMTNEIEFIDPSYNYILPTVNVFYDSNQTSLTSDQIASKVAASVQLFETSNLGKFDNDYFRFSKFSAAIDDSDPSITYNNTSILLQKRFVPSTTNTTKYTINFDKELFNETDVSTIVSTGFTLSGNDRTYYLDDDGNGNVRTYYINSLNQDIYTNNTFGTIDYEKGIIVLPSFGPTSIVNNELKITVVPKDYNLITNKYLLMLLSDTVISVTDERAQRVNATVTVTTTGSVTQINETNIGTVI
jgi:hypothetical protein